jgi:hypothetical protein
MNLANPMQTLNMAVMTCAMMWSSLSYDQGSELTPGAILPNLITTTSYTPFSFV